MKIAQKGPTLTHLFFADDSLIFCKASVQEAKAAVQVIEDYGKASGQVSNADKSSIFFSKNMREEVRQQILQVMGGMKQVKKSQYLGLPMVIGRSKSTVFKYIKEKIARKLNHWKERLLSPARK